MTGGDDLRKQTDEDREQALRVERERLAKQRETNQPEPGKAATRFG